MLLATPTAEAEKSQRQVHVNGHDYILREYVGNMPLRGKYVEGNEKNDNGMPQGFLVYQPPGSVTPPHFHETNQFQVFVDGSGSMGKYAAAPLTVQYANGHTPYGPIVAGEEGVRYFTLRQQWDPGAKYMPQSRGKLQKGNQRTRIKANIPVYSDGERAERQTVRVESIFESESDGLSAGIYYLGECDSHTLPSPSETGGQYLVVVSGMMTHDGKAFDCWSTIYVTPDEKAFEVQAGHGGLDLLLLEFPRH
ncbi:MAG: hypothetical protein HOK54_20500 [Alphaproteobacteria bacterium]|jgi:hypothetical protein|nr:hypothetical protein [Alphaproteobacteria bacterium]